MIETEDQVFLIPETSQNDLDISSSGNKQLVVVVHKTEYGSSEAATLEGMISAIKYDMTSDIFLVQLKDRQNISINNVLREYKDIILLGVEPSEIGIFVDFVQYEIIHFEKSRMLVSHSISEIKSAPPKKMLLWNKLQEMFLLKQ